MLRTIQVATRKTPVQKSQVFITQFAAIPAKLFVMNSESKKRNVLRLATILIRSVRDDQKCVEWDVKPCSTNQL